MQALRQIHDGITNNLHIILPPEFLHRKLEVIILPLDNIETDQAATRALEHFLVSKDTEALADLDTDAFSLGRKTDPGRMADL